MSTRDAEIARTVLLESRMADINVVDIQRPDRRSGSVASSVREGAITHREPSGERQHRAREARCRIFVADHEVLVEIRLRHR